MKPNREYLWAGKRPQTIQWHHEERHITDSYITITGSPFRSKMIAELERPHYKIIPQHEPQQNKQWIDNKITALKRTSAETTEVGVVFISLVKYSP